MKTKLTLALVALITSSAFAAIPAILPEFKNEKQLAEWREEMAAKAESNPSTLGVRCSTPDVPSTFYTGKPYIESTGSYAFKYRNYNPELARWTSEDPSGFPDGANQNIYAPIPTCELDWAGLLTVNTSVAGVPRQFSNGGIVINALSYEATTKKGNTFMVDKFVSVLNPPPGPPPEVPYDFTQNCHGYVFLPGYWVRIQDVPTILADEWVLVSQKKATIVVYDTNMHSVKVVSRETDGNIDDVIGKNGYHGAVTTNVNGTGYGNPKFYE